MNVCIEAEAGSTVKYHYDEKTMTVRGQRTVCRAYPYPYGFITGTLTDDSEAVDCYVITKTALKGGITVECDAVGILEMFEDGETDHKVLAALPGETPRIDEGLRKELEDFILEIFTSYPEMNIQIGRLLSKEEALKHLRKNRVK